MMNRQRLGEGKIGKGEVMARERENGRRGNWVNSKRDRTMENGKGRRKDKEGELEGGKGKRLSQN